MEDEEVHCGLTCQGWFRLFTCGALIVLIVVCGVDLHQDHRNHNRLVEIQAMLTVIYDEEFPSTRGLDADAKEGRGNTQRFSILCEKFPEKYCNNRMTVGEAIGKLLTDTDSFSNQLEIPGPLDLVRQIQKPTLGSLVYAINQTLVGGVEEKVDANAMLLIEINTTLANISPP